MRAIFLATALAVVSAPGVGAGQEDRVQSRTEFVDLIADRQLTRFGIRLNVSPEGQITGRAFGKPVTGRWEWADGYFCRDLYFGDQDLGPNCQVVQRRKNGGVLRFIADRGQGDHADLRLD